MSIWQAILLGAVQGLTEFLPVSSSGHLVLVQDVMGLRLPGLTFEIMVHGGTLLAVLIVFGPRVLTLLKGTTRWLRYGPQAGPGDVGSARMLLLLGWASVPAAVVGLTLRNLVEHLFSTPIYAALGLLITGGLLFMARDKGRTGKPVGRAGPIMALFIGCFQALAIAPGISRSGSTITAGLWMGFSRRASAEFSFLLSIPAIVGALSVDFTALGGREPVLGLDVLLAGSAAAAVFGYMAIKVLLKFLQEGRYHLFAYYVWAVSFLVLFSQVK